MLGSRASFRDIQENPCLVQSPQTGWDKLGGSGTTTLVTKGEPLPTNLLPQNDIHKNASVDSDGTSSKKKLFREVSFSHCPPDKGKEDHLKTKSHTTSPPRRRRDHRATQKLWKRNENDDTVVLKATHSCRGSRLPPSGVDTETNGIGISWMQPNVKTETDTSHNDKRIDDNGGTDVTCNNFDVASRQPCPVGNTSSEPNSSEPNSAAATNEAGEEESAGSTSKLSASLEPSLCTAISDGAAVCADERDQSENGLCEAGLVGEDGSQSHIPDDAQPSLSADAVGKCSGRKAAKSKKPHVVVEGLEEVLRHSKEIEANKFVIKGLDRFRKRDFDTAAKLFRSGLRLKIAALGTDHEHVSLIREKLGDALVKIDRNLDAERMYDLAVQNLKAKIGSVNEDLARILASQGDLYRKMGKHPLALACYKESLSVRSKLRDIDRQTHPNVGTSHVMLGAGIALGRQGSIQSATSLFTQAYTRIGTDHEEEDVVPYVLNSIGNIKFKQGDYSHAIKYYKKSLKIHVELGGKSRQSDMWSTMSNLGKAYFADNRYDRAIDCLSTAAKRFSNSDLPTRDLEVAALWTKIGSAYFKKKEYETAMDYYTKSLKAKHVLLKDDNHPEILLTQHDIGLVLYKQGRLDNAMSIFEDIKRKRVISGGTSNPDFAKLLVDMSAIHLKRGGAEGLEKAERLCETASHILDAVKIPGGHPYVRQVHEVVEKISQIKTSRVTL